LGTIKIDDDVYQKLNELAQKQGRSIKELATQAIRLYLEGTSEDVVDAELDSFDQKWIRLRFPARCKGCGKSLNAGEEAYYIRYTYKDNKVPPKTVIYCINCYFEKVVTDEVLAKRYAKLRELERIVKYYERKARELADVVVIDDLLKAFLHAREVVSQMISKKSFEDGDVRRLEEVYDKIDNLMKVLSTAKVKLQEVRRRRVEPWASRKRY